MKDVQIQHWKHQDDLNNVADFKQVNVSWVTLNTPQKNVFH